jgi:oligosaccharide reducing-end xylanase
VRTEGIGLAMMIAVQLDKREEFDRLWTYATAVLQYKDAPSADTSSRGATRRTRRRSLRRSVRRAQMLTALIFAHDRWGSTHHHRLREPRAWLLTVMRHKQDENGGVVERRDRTRSTRVGACRTSPTESRRGYGRPSIVMPRTTICGRGDRRSVLDARGGRRRARTGEDRASDDGPDAGARDVRGRAVPNWDDFLPSRIARRSTWRSTRSGRGEPDAWEVSEANTLLRSSACKGIETYGATSRSTDGRSTRPRQRRWSRQRRDRDDRDEARRDAYIERVWELGRRRACRATTPASSA